MDSETKAKIKAQVIGGCVALLLLAGVVGWLYKISGMDTKPSTTVNYLAEQHQQAISTSGDKNLFAEQEENREVLLEQQREAQLLAKKKAKKESSHECQFWRLQQKQGKSAIASEKVEQYCTLDIEASQLKL